MMDFQQIQDLIKLVGKMKISEFEIKQGDFKLIIRGQADAPENVGVQYIPAQNVPAPIVISSPSLAPVHSPQVQSAESASAVETKAVAVSPQAAPAPVGNEYIVKSPMVGTFYRAGGPDKPPFVKIGDEIQVGSKLCIIEAMKLFNEIESEVAGKVVKVLVDDGSAIEYDQPLFLIEPK